MKFTASIDESVEKNKSLSSRNGGFAFKYVIYVKRNTRDYFIGKFWSTWRKLRYYSYLC